VKLKNGFTGIEILVGVVVVLVIGSAIFLVVRDSGDGVIESVNEQIDTPTITSKSLAHDQLETEVATITIPEEIHQEESTATPYIHPTVTLASEQNQAPTATSIPPTNTPVLTEIPVATPTSELLPTLWVGACI